MKCRNCKSVITDDSLYCPVCGVRLDDERDAFDELEEEEELRDRKTKNNLLVIIIICVVAVLVIGVGGFFVYRSMQEVEDEKEIRIEETEESEEKSSEEKEQVDASKVDINVVDDRRCTLVGSVKKAKDGSRILSWSEGISVYGLDENSNRVLVEDVTSVYINEARLASGILDSVAANQKVKISGDLYIKNNDVHMDATKLMDENGKEIVLQKEEKNETPTVAASSGYILPDSDKRALTEADVRNLNLRQVNYAKNEIYARHGRKFNSPELQNYFNSQSWYKGTIEPDNFSDSLLSAVEQQNAAFLRNLEFSMASNGYQLDQ